MSDPIVSRCETGENAVFHANGKSVSVYRTDVGLFDVRGDNEKTLYAGLDQVRAYEAMQAYLKRNPHA